MSNEMRKHIDTFKNFLIKETFFDLNTDFKQSLNKLDTKDKIDFTKIKEAEMNNNNENSALNKPAVISRLEQAEIIAKAVIKFGDLNKVSKWSGVPVWLLQNVLQGNEIRQTQYDKMVWMRDRLNGL